MDTQVVVYLKDRDNNFNELNGKGKSRTEIFENSKNPHYKKTFIIDYNFEKSTILKFAVYDIDDFEHKKDLERQKFIGFVICSIHEIVCSKNHILK